MDFQLGVWSDIFQYVVFISVLFPWRTGICSSISSYIRHPTSKCTSDTHTFRNKRYHVERLLSYSYFHCARILTWKYLALKEREKKRMRKEREWKTLLRNLPGIILSAHWTRILSDENSELCVIRFSGWCFPA